ncbi:MAG: AtpZ/AtpI family protein [Pseudomonadota bacterium]
MSTEPDKEGLQALNDRLEALKKSQGLGPRADEHYSAANQGWRMVTELVAGLGIGFAIGYGLDYAFGTLPIFMVIFTLLGFAAGINVMMRTAKEFGEEHAADAADKVGAAEAARNEKDD